MAATSELAYYSIYNACIQWFFLSIVQQIIYMDLFWPECGYKWKDLETLISYRRKKREKYTNTLGNQKKKFKTIL